jgi:hypothetical protein
MYETVMFETVMFIIIMLARVDCFKNTALEQLGWEPHGIVLYTSLQNLPGSHGAEHCTRINSAYCRKI